MDRPSKKLDFCFWGLARKLLLIFVVTQWAHIAQANSNKNSIKLPLPNLTDSKAAHNYHKINIAKLPIPEFTNIKHTSNHHKINTNNHSLRNHRKSKKTKIYHRMSNNKFLIPYSIITKITYNHNGISTKMLPLSNHGDVKAIQTTNRKNKAPKKHYKIKANKRTSSSGRKIKKTNNRKRTATQKNVSYKVIPRRRSRQLYPNQHFVIGVVGGGQKVSNPLNFGVLGDAGIGDDTPVGEELSVQTHTHPIRGIKLGYCYKKNGIFVQYTHYKSSDITPVTAGPDEKIWSTLLPPEFNEDASTFAEGSFEGTYDFTDLYFSHTFLPLLSGIVGISQGSLLSHWNVFYRGGDIPGAFTLPVRWDSLYNGTGLLVGFNLSYALSRALHIIGDMKGRFFYGNTSTRLFSADTNGTIIDANNRFKSFVPELTAEAGLSLILHFHHSQSYVNFTFAYQYNSLFNQSAFTTTAQNRSSAITEKRTVQWGGFLGKIIFQI